MHNYSLCYKRDILFNKPDLEKMFISFNMNSREKNSSQITKFKKKGKNVNFKGHFSQFMMNICEDSQSKIEKRATV